MELNNHRSPQGEEEARFWLQEVIRKFEEVNLPQPQEPSIYRVPRGAHPYEPEIIRFGIYERSLTLPLLPMEEWKIESIRHRVRKEDRQSFITHVIESVNEIKRVYDDFPEHYSEEVIAWLFTMDACFILRFLNPEKDNQDFSQPNLLTRGITKDIFKLENQIPLFFLLKILKLKPDNINSQRGEISTNLEPETWLAEKLCHHVFFQKAPFSLNAHPADVKGFIENGRHLLDVLRRTIKHFLSNTNPGCTQPTVSSLNNSLEGPKKYLIRSAKALHTDGIRFKVSQGGKVGFEKRWFGNTLVIPQMYLGEDIEPIVRNLMAFEDRLVGEEATISQFMVLMGCLIESSRDVDLFRNAGIIETRIGSNEDIAKQFNNLCKGFSDKCSNYENVAQLLQNHGENPIHGWTNSIWEEIRSKPWHMAAILLLIMTAMQTYYAAKQTHYAAKQ